MASITSAASGDWNNTATWTPAQIPIAGDTVTITNGHTVTIPAGYTAECGISGTPGTPAVRTAGTGGTGALTVNGTLRVFGDLRQSGNAVWRVNGGGVVESANTTTALVWYTGDGASQTSGYLYVTGTGPAANRAIVRVGAGSAGFTINNNLGGSGPWGAGRVEMSWALITLGSASAAINFGGGSGFRVHDTIFDGCGTVQPITGLSFSTTGTLEILRTTVQNSLAGTYAVRIDSNTTLTAPGVRLIEDLVVRDKVFRVANLGDITFRRCVFRGNTEFTGHRWAAFEDCLVSWNTAVTVHGNVLRGIRAQEGAAVANWHGYVAGAFDMENTIDGVVFDGCTEAGIGQGGDLIIVPSPASPRTLTVRNCLVAKGARAGGAHGKLVSMLGNANATVTVVENCTHFSRPANEFGLLGISETYAGRANMVQALRNNLTVGASANQGVLSNRDQEGVKDCITQGGVQNNVVFNAYNGGTNPPGYWSPTATNTFWTSGTPEAVLDLDPQFVDDTRNLATWIRSVIGGTPGTRVADTVLAIDELCKRNDDSGWNSGATIPDAWTWIRAGYAPTNIALKTDVSANNGGWVGAVEGISAPTTTFLPHLYAN